MLIVKIFNDDSLVQEMKIMLLGGGRQGVGGATGYDYVLMSPKHPDMPPIAHKPEEGDLVLVAKTLMTFINVSANNPDNIIQFPKPK